VHDRGSRVTHILLVRHGESTWNAESRWQGHADPPLSVLGEQQAAAAADTLSGIEVVWTSDLVRARRTAEIIASRLDVPVQVDARLRERDVGDWTGLTRAEIEERWPGWVAARRSPSGFEGDASVATRALAALREIAAGATSDALVVSHGGLIRTVERWLGAEPEPVANLAGRSLDTDGAGLVLGSRVLLIDPDDIEVTVPPPR
jgi:broad specificity phosphatase PhoE